MFRQKPSTRSSSLQLTTSRGSFHFISGKVQTVFSDDGVSQCVRVQGLVTRCHSPCLVFLAPVFFFFFTRDILRILLVLVFSKLVYCQAFFFL